MKMKNKKGPQKTCHQCIGKNKGKWMENINVIGNQISTLKLPAQLVVSKFADY